ncbi:protein of unknown function [Moritella yayanosii]|uniref:Uncharacterized protein n=1 Tax=Moritella yayanosii TaxID=69539 RepID=A0A330LUH6_9GAMM|nr:protein of unknown function [Moritella yayanosii]
MCCWNSKLPDWLLLAIVGGSSNGYVASVFLSGRDACLDDHFIIRGDVGIDLNGILAPALYPTAIADFSASYFFASA